MQTAGQAKLSWLEPPQAIEIVNDTCNGAPNASQSAACSHTNNAAECISTVRSATHQREVPGEGAPEATSPWRKAAFASSSSNNDDAETLREEQEFGDLAPIMEALRYGDASPHAGTRLADVSDPTSDPPDVAAVTVTARAELHTLPSVMASVTVDHAQPPLTSPRGARIAQQREPMTRATRFSRVRTTFSCPVFCEEVVYNVIGYVAVPLILWRHGRAGLMNRGHVTNLLQVVVTTGWLVAHIFAVVARLLPCSSPFRLGYDISQWDLVGVNSAIILRAIVIAVKHATMTRAERRRIDREVLPAHVLARQYVLVGWLTPGTAILGDELERALVRVCPELPQLVCAFPSEAARADAIRSMYACLPSFCRHHGYVLLSDATLATLEDTQFAASNLGSPLRDASPAVNGAGTTASATSRTADGNALYSSTAQRSFGEDARATALDRDSGKSSVRQEAGARHRTCCQLTRLNTSSSDDDGELDDELRAPENERMGRGNVVSALLQFVQAPGHGARKMARYCRKANHESPGARGCLRGSVRRLCCCASTPVVVPVASPSGVGEQHRVAIDAMPPSVRASPVRHWNDRTVTALLSHPVFARPVMQAHTTPVHPEIPSPPPSPLAPEPLPGKTLRAPPLGARAPTSGMTISVPQSLGASTRAGSATPPTSATAPTVADSPTATGSSRTYSGASDTDSIPLPSFPAELLVWHVLYQVYVTEAPRTARVAVGSSVLAGIGFASLPFLTRVAVGKPALGQSWQSAMHTLSLSVLAVVFMTLMVGYTVMGIVDAYRRLRCMRLLAEVIDLRNRSAFTIHMEPAPAAPASTTNTSVESNARVAPTQRSPDAGSPSRQGRNHSGAARSADGVPKTWASIDNIAAQTTGATTPQYAAAGHANRSTSSQSASTRTRSKLDMATVASLAMSAAVLRENAIAPVPTAQPAGFPPNPVETRAGVKRMRSRWAKLRALSTANILPLAGRPRIRDESIMQHFEDELDVSSRGTWSRATALDLQDTTSLLGTAAERQPGDPPASTPLRSRSDGPVLPVLYAENILAWSASRTLLEDFGSVFALRINIYTIFTVCAVGSGVANLVYMTLADQPDVTEGLLYFAYALIVLAVVLSAQIFSGTLYNNFASDLADRLSKVDTLAVTLVTPPYSASLSPSFISRMTHVTEAVRVAASALMLSTVHHPARVAGMPSSPQLLITMVSLVSSTVLLVFPKLSKLLSADQPPGGSLLAPCP